MISETDTKQTQLKQVKYRYAREEWRLERTRVSHGDFIAFIGVEPNLALATLEYAGGEPLL